MAKKKQTKRSTGSAVGIGVGLTAAAVAAAGAYFLYGSEHAAKNRKKVKSWMLKAKAEVLEALERAEKMTEEEYQALVDKVTATYSRMQTLSKRELKDFEKEMKECWKGIAKSGKKRAPRAAKKTTKKTAQR